MFYAHSAISKIKPISSSSENNDDREIKNQLTQKLCNLLISRNLENGISR